jgi:hypothetical protein
VPVLEERPLRGSETLKAKFKSDPSRSNREDAKRTLDEVRRRYGIHALDTRAYPHVVNSLKTPTVREDPTRPTIRPGPSTSKLPPFPAELQSSLPLGRAPTRHPTNRATGSTPDNRNFHFLIRIAECALTLLCEITADSEAAARHHVKQIPNLLEWREIGGEEFVSLVRDFRQPCS